MIKARRHYVWAILIILGIVAPAFGGDAPRILTSMDFTIVGVSLQVGPAYQAVPKGIASQVTTGFVNGDKPLSDAILAMLPKDFKVVGELTGPTYQTPVILTTTPEKPFDLPTFTIVGKYALANIRLEDNSGKALFAASPQAVVIESISDPIVTSVSTRPLTLAELRDRGVTFDSTNFTTYEFTGAIGLTSNQEPIKFPVLIPNTVKGIDDELPASTNLGLALPVVANPPQLPNNFSLQGFVMEPEKLNLDTGGVELPPIAGLIMIPNNIGFLHQYFSALLIVTNGAPTGSNLIVRDITATIGLPTGEDQNPGTDENPGDDPLRMARGNAGYFPRAMAVMNTGPDGKAGTADDVGLLKPAESGQADFTVEGLKEGTHKINFRIDATLEGLPIGAVRIKGEAMGAVLVRNPDFSITLGHPSTVRSGEAYDLFVTISNTSSATANLVSTHLDQRALSGAILALGEEADKQIETILPGSSATVKYHLISQRTGQVTATAFQSEEAGVQGRFILRMGVDETGIPMSPDSLIIPYTGTLPADVVDAAVGLLGQAWSVATAPTGALPGDVLYIDKTTISERANDLSEAGLRLLIGESTVNALEDLSFDFFGSDNANEAFDSLRRRSTQGLNLNGALAAFFQAEATSAGPFAFQTSLAQKEAYRPGHISVITNAVPVRVQITDGAGSRTGNLSAGTAAREIAYGDQLLLKDAGGGAGSSLALLTKLASTSYRLDVRAEESATLDLGIVIPDANGNLRQVRFNRVAMTAGARGTVTLLPGTNADYVLSLDDNGDGIPDRSVSSESTIISATAVRMVAAAQLVPGFGPGGDKHGRNIAVLFNQRVTKESAQDVANFAVEENAVMVSYIQKSGRMAFLQLRDGIGPFFGAIDPATGYFNGRAITVSGLVSQSGGPSASATLPIRITAQGPAAAVSGVVRTAQGTPIPGVTVRLLQQVLVDGEPAYVILSEKSAQNNGSYHFDYVIRNDSPAGPFRIEAINAAANEAGDITAGVAYNGQQMTLDIFMKAKGSLSGTVRDASGNPVANAAVQVTTLSDSRVYSAVADGAGLYTFTNLRVGAYSLKAVSQALFAEGSTMGTLPENGAAAAQDIVIYSKNLPQGEVTGTVTNRDGTPRAGMVVLIRGERYESWMRTDTAGKFAFLGVFTGPVTVRATEDATGEGSTVAGAAVENGTTVLNIILKGSGAVAVQVTREDGLSAGGFYVIARVNNVDQVAVTDAAGRAIFDNVPVGDVSLRVPDPRSEAAILIQDTVTVLAAGETANIALAIPASAFTNSTITGTVYKRDGSVWANAPVILIQDMEEGTYRPYTADANGKYTIPNPNDPQDSLALGTYKIVVVSGSEIANGTASLWVNGQTKVLDLHAAGMGTIEGTIYDQVSGMMPVGADVTLYAMKPNRMGWLSYSAGKAAASVKSNAQTGRYAFTGVYTGPVVVSASNIFRPEPVNRNATLATDGDALTLDLTLQDTFGSIYGQVVLPNNTPASSGVRITVRYGGADVTVTTDSTGKFAFSHAIPAGTYRVLVEDPVTTLKAAAAMTVPAGQDVPVTIRLLGRGSITVTVTTNAGEAVVGSQVTVTGTDFPQDSASGTTDASGQVTFGNLTEGAYAISAMGANQIGGRGQASITADGAAATATVRLDASGTITGRFLKADAATPIVGGQIKLINADRQVIGYTSSSSGAGDTGVFRLETVPLGSFTLEGYDPVTDRKGVGSGRITQNAQTVNADIILVPQGTIRGVVMNNTGTAPIAGAAVTATVSGAVGYSQAAVSAPDGSFVFAGVPPGRFSITVFNAETGLSGSGSGTLSYEGETARPEIRLQPSGGITGHVFLPDGATPAPNVSVICYNTVTGSESAITQTDAAGAYRFTNLPAKNAYRLQASESGTHRAARITAAIPSEGEVTTVDIILQGVGVVQGTLCDADGTTPLPGAPVFLRAVGQGSGITAEYTDYTDGNGAFRFTDVPAGTFTLQGSYPGRDTGAAGSGALTGEGRTVTVNLTMGPVATITGTVLMADGVTPARGGIVRFTGCGKTYGALIDGAGLYLMEKIPLCDTFSLYMEDAAATGIGYATGRLAVNGATLNMGTTVLDDRAIAITGVTPVAGTVDVPVNAAVTVTFSEPADPTTVTATSLYLLGGDGAADAAVTLAADGMTATLTPSSPLTGFSLYTVVATTSIRDRVGRTLPQMFTSTFTTLDTIAPVVTAMSPAGGAVQVAPDGVVRITFSKAIDPASTGDIKLMQNTGTVPTRLDVVQSGTVVILTPLSPLLPNTSYNINISGVKDLSGNAMTGVTASGFNTVDTIAPTVSGLTIPENATLVKGGRVSVRVLSADTDVASVDFYVDGLLVATRNEAPFMQEILLTKEGPVTIRVVAQDRFGNRNPDAAHAREITMTVTADQPPTVAIASPSEGNAVNPGTMLIVSVDAADDLAISEVSLAATGGIVFAQTAGDLTANTYRIDFSVPVPADAVAGTPVELTATAKDSAGHTSKAVRHVVINDNAAPVLTITSPRQSVLYKPGEAGTAIVLATDNTGVATLSCSVGGEGTGSQTFAFDPVQPQLTQRFDFQVNAAAAPFDQIIISCAAWDATGNRSSASALALTVADTVPAVAVSATIQDNSVTVPVNTSIGVTFSEPLRAETVGESSIRLILDDGSNQIISGTVSLSADRKTITFRPATDLTGGMPYRFIIDQSVTDDAGNSPAADYVLRFTTSNGALIIQNQGTETDPALLPPGGYNNVSIIDSWVKTTGAVTAEAILVTNSTLLSGGLITAGALGLSAGSTLTYGAATVSETSQLELVATTLTVDATSKLDVSGRGYLGGYANGNDDYSGRTLGNTATGGSYYLAGGSHGGLGGTYYDYQVNGVYGDLTTPDAQGSGGGGDYATPGGNGGGLVKITAGSLSLDGRIGANGDDSSYRGSGSGGGVLINVTSLSGSGTISARGGNAGYYGAGGGGRIAIYYDTMTLPLANISAAGGMSGNGAEATQNGGAGTVYLKKRTDAHGDLIVDNGGIVTARETPVPGNAYSRVTASGGAKIVLTGSLVTETDLVIDGSQLLLDGGITVPGNLTLTGGATVSVAGTVTVMGNLLVQGNSTLTHAGATTTAQSRLVIQAANVTVDATSKLDVSGRGYLGGYANGNDDYSGRTLGNTATGGSYYLAGGSHGGLGGTYYDYQVNGVYDDLTNPDAPGSGGGGDYATPGGNGGGLVKITAGSLSLDGGIWANGDHSSYRGAGSGGGILINVTALFGSGTIGARGGNAGYYGAGGGGQIAIYYDTMTLPLANISAAGGMSGSGAEATQNGGAGTVYLKKRTDAYGDLIVDNGSIDARDDSTPLSVVGRSVITALTANSLTDSGATWRNGTLRGLKVNPNINQDKAFTITANDGTTLSTDEADGDLTQSAAVGNTYSGIYRFNSVKIMGKAKARCDERLSVAVDFIMDMGRLSANDISANRISLTNGAVLTHPNTTETVEYGLALTAASTLTVDATSRIDVSGKGYLGGYAGGSSTYIGRTYGNTIAGGSEVYSGGSYGGLGGAYPGFAVAMPYGFNMSPHELGSGGGGYNPGMAGGNGGGLVLITATTAVVNGAILADGGSGATSVCTGGGAGGGIFINVTALSGNGGISAKGGASPLGGGAGGGGRIAVYYHTLTLPPANVIAVGGISSDPAYNGMNGTVYFHAK